MTLQAALVSVGGSPAPVLHVLRQHRPGHVWYFCSPGIRANTDAIQTQLECRFWSRPMTAFSVPKPVKPTASAGPSSSWRALAAKLSHQ